MIDETIISKLRRLMEARDERDSANKVAKAKEKEYRELEAEVYEVLDESALRPPFKVDVGDPFGEVRFHPRETIYGRVIDEEAALTYFEDRAIVDEMTNPKIVMQRVNEIARDCVEQGDPLPPGLDFYPKRFVAITRQK